MKWISSCSNDALNGTSWHCHIILTNLNPSQCNWQIIFRTIVLAIICQSYWWHIRHRYLITQSSVFTPRSYVHRNIVNPEFAYLTQFLNPSPNHAARCVQDQDNTRRPAPDDPECWYRRCHLAWRIHLAIVWVLTYYLPFTNAERFTYGDVNSVEVLTTDVTYIHLSVTRACYMDSMPEHRHFDFKCHMNVSHILSDRSVWRPEFRSGHYGVNSLWPTDASWCHRTCLTLVLVFVHVVTYPFPNFNGCTIQIWEWISNFIPRFKMEVITYPCSD